MPPRNKQPRPPDQWRNRIVGHGEMTADEFAANPRNPRIHGDTQRAAVSSLLDDVGWVAPLVVNRTTGLLLDGHMRVEEAAARGPIPVVWVELTETEEAEVLALLDPIGAMASHDPNTLADLVASMDSTVDVDAVLAGLLPGSTEADQPGAQRPATVKLKPLSRAHVLLSLPLEQWADIADTIDKLARIPGVEVTSTMTVN